MTVATDIEAEARQLLASSIGPACHELRSPLAVVYGFAKMLEQAPANEGQRESYVAAIVRSSQRLDTMLDGLSDLGRIAAGRIHPALETVSLRALVSDLASTSTNDGRLKLDAPDDVHVLADPMWLSDALQGVIESCCFDEEITARLSWVTEPHDVIVEVAPHSSFPMIDVEPHKAGIALNLARMQVVAMGGSFTGRGDRISLSLPRAPHK